MILSGHEIKRQLGTNIVITPFDELKLNPNSYNLSLHDELLVYEEVVLDMRKSNRVQRVKIPQEGLVLTPNQLYLGRTIERTETHNYVPMIEGRSSIGRLGLFVHVTAGFGDVGFCGYWTLEMFAVQPIKIYPGVSICQLFSTKSQATSLNIRVTSIRTTEIFSRACSFVSCLQTVKQIHNSNLLFTLSNACKKLVVHL